MIINMTPHPVNIITNSTFDASIRKWVAPSDTAPTVTIPSTGVLNAKIATIDADPIGDIPIFTKSITGCDPLPDLGDGDFVIVSALFATAFRAMGGDCSRILLVADPVMTPDGKTFLGCRGLTPVF